MDEEQLVSLRMVICLVISAVFGVIAIIAEDIPFALVMFMFLAGTFAGFTTIAFKAAGRFFLSYGVMFFMWLPLSLITGGFICGASLVCVFLFSQLTIRLRLEYDEEQARIESRNHDYRHRKSRRKRRNRRRNYDKDYC